LKFLGEVVRETDWDIPIINDDSENAESNKKYYQEMHEWKKNRLKDYLNRLREYRKLLKKSRKN
jgi:hypothetical protein